jgi:hypothetical protein
MDVASWWITWVLFGLIAWGGLGLLLVWAVHRFFCWQAGRADKPVPYWPAGKADEVLSSAWTAADMEILEGKKLP